GAITHTTREGNPYHPFNLCQLVNAAGAAYVARYMVTQGPELVGSIKKALQIEGFTFIEAISPCPTQFGRQNGLDTPRATFKFVEDMCITEEDARGLSAQELTGKIVTGEFSNGRS
ncbi:MAG: 2-oxoacid:ferredoxin oxidoreductase subunit beta, partial [Chloroflexota bacterium]|nr:2-oxoacid:ferredoxin oxidoreductase subunit beta [Chloroflexota bacterium]